MILQTKTRKRKTKVATRAMRALLVNEAHHLRTDPPRADKSGCVKMPKTTAAV